MSIKELMFTLIAYGILSMFLTFSEIKHERSKKSIDNKNRKLFLEMRRDSLSKLPNLLTLNEYLNTNKQNISLLYIHMDNFDTLIYAFGNKFSDKIIVNVSNVLKSFENEKIKLYHTEAHRFAFVISETFKNEDIQFAKSICTVFEQVNIDYESTSIPISISVGIARGDDEKIVFQAKTALNEVIEKGDINYKLFEFDKNRQDKQNNDIYWLQNIKDTIQKDQLVVYYQPIIDNKTGKISKYESLVRAMHNGKVISPFFFLDAAKSAGMLDSITRSVIEKSFNKFKNESYEFSINITQKDLNSDYFIDYLIKKIDKYSINPNRVILEILENISSLESKQMLDKLHKLKDLGFQIAIDDFGAEASNFSRLLSIDANIIKIDAQFIKNIHTNSNSYKIVEAIVSLAKNLGAKTVAEFVHNEEVYEIVKKLDVDYSQGFFLGEPLPNIDTKKDKLELETV
jgi:EAL domain-containing protein (putative c-di-GMP-specific phosphodiesterase class I)